MVLKLDTNLTHIELILSIEKQLIETKYWVRTTDLNFDNMELPIARIEFGRILSNGLHEKSIGSLDIMFDGSIKKHFHL